MASEVCVCGGEGALCFCYFAVILVISHPARPKFKFELKFKAVLPFQLGDEGSG